MTSLWEEEAIWSRTSARGMRSHLAATQPTSILACFCPALVRPVLRSARAKRRFGRPRSRRGSLLRGGRRRGFMRALRSPACGRRSWYGRRAPAQVVWRRRSWLVGRGSRAKVVLRTQAAGSTLPARALANTAMELTSLALEPRGYLMPSWGTQSGVGIAVRSGRSLSAIR